MTDDDTGVTEGETKESGDQLAQSLAPEPSEFSEQPGPQPLIPERGELAEHPIQPLASEPGKLPERPAPQTLIPERGELPERPTDN